MSTRSITITRRLAFTLMVLCLPIVLITSSAGIVIHSGWLYNYGFDKYNSAHDTGIEPSDLLRVSRDFKAYFKNDLERLQTVVRVHGQERPLYNEREVLHMVDVKSIVQNVVRLQLITLVLFLLVAGVALMRMGGRAGLAFLTSALLWGSLSTIGVLVAAGLGSLVGFDALFVRFHELLFTNDLWLLDPNTDYLLKMFPEGFFLDATLIIAGFSLAGAIAVGTASGAWLLWARRCSARVIDGAG